MLLKNQQHELKTLTEKNNEPIHIVNQWVRESEHFYNAIRKLQVYKMVDEAFLGVQQYFVEATQFHTKRMQQERGQLSQEVLSTEQLVNILSI